MFDTADYYSGGESERIVGRALKFMLEIRLEEGLVGDEEIRRRLDSWWATQPKLN